MSDKSAVPPRADARAARGASRIHPTGPPGQFEPPAPPTGARRRRPSPTGPTQPAGHRRLDVSTIGSLALGLPWFVSSLALVVFVGWAIGGTVGNAAAVPVFVVVAWLLSGALIFYRRVEVILARLLLRARRPTPSERERLQPAWRDVTTAAGRDGSRYELFVEDSDTLNAYATSGHIVTVTRRTLDAMPHHHLAAVLAHEFGHHLGGHSWSNLLSYWYSVPARLLVRVLRLIMRIVISAFAVISAIVARVPLLASLIARVITFSLAVFVIAFITLLVVVAVREGHGWAVPAVLLVLLTPVLLPWLARRSEFRADRVAAELGFGQALIEVFEDWLRQGHDDGRRGVVSRLFSTHPRLPTRIRKLDVYLQRNT